MKQVIAALLLYACSQLSPCHAMELATPSLPFLDPKLIIKQIPIFNASFVEFIDDEKIIVNGKRSADSCSDRSLCTIKNWQTNATIATITSNYKRVSLSPKKTVIALTDGFNQIILYNACGRKKTLKNIAGDVALQCAFTASGDVVFSHYKSGILSLFDLEKNSIESYQLTTQIRTYACHPREPKKICQPILTNRSEYSVLCLFTYDLTTQPITIKTQAFFVKHEQDSSARPTIHTYNHDGSFFACIDTNGNAYIADLARDICSLLPKNKDERFENIFFYGNSSIAVTLSTQRDTVRFWNSQTMQEIISPLRLPSDIITLAFSPNKNLLLLALIDKTVMMHVPPELRYELKQCILKYGLLRKYNKNNHHFLSRDILHVLMKMILYVYKR